MIEVIHEGVNAAKAAVVIFDFDGTLSLIRSGWMDIMVPLCIEQLAGAGGNETEAELRAVAEDFIWRLTGKETIYQMMALADAIRERGGQPLEPLAYKRMYLERLMAKIRYRLEELRSGAADPVRYLVPGARPLLESLVSRGLRLFLASGTDEANVKEEATLLGVAPFFEGRIFGAQDHPGGFSKAALVRQILGETSGFSPDQLVVFGDGFVEIEEVKKVGGIAVGVASAEPECQSVDDWKRRRLIAVGADFIVPNFLSLNALSEALFPAAALIET